MKICVAYRKPNGEEISHYPASLVELAQCEPVYEELPGWNEDITGCRSLKSFLKMHATMFVVFQN